MKEVGVTFPATTADFVCSKVNLEMQKKKWTEDFFWMWELLQYTFFDYILQVSASSL